jgi:dynein light intermediate chain
MKARETGICPVREQLYNECFDELIRQVTINCLERGILLMRIKKEIEMTINSYQNLYESAIAYGIRTALISEETKNTLTKQIKSVDDECFGLNEKIRSLEEQIEKTTREDAERRERENKQHEEYVTTYRERNTKLKEDIKNKLQSNFKN